jgi:uncharacterized protein (DUF427 family)
MARAIWNGVVLAETSRPVLLEGNVYFPPQDVRQEYLVKTRAWSVCPWKGLARYYGAGRRAGEQERRLVLPAPQPARPQDQKPRGVLERGPG